MIKIRAKIDLELKPAQGQKRRIIKKGNTIEISESVFKQLERKNGKFFEVLDAKMDTRPAKEKRDDAKAKQEKKIVQPKKEIKE